MWVDLFRHPGTEQIDSLNRDWGFFNRFFPETCSTSLNHAPVKMVNKLLAHSKCLFAAWDALPPPLHAGKSLTKHPQVFECFRSARLQLIKHVTKQKFAMKTRDAQLQKSLAFYHFTWSSCVLRRKKQITLLTKHQPWITESGRCIENRGFFGFTLCHGSQWHLDDPSRGHGACHQQKANGLEKSKLYKHITSWRCKLKYYSWISYRIISSQTIWPYGFLPHHRCFVENSV